jgi:hypothetical protein
MKRSQQTTHGGRRPGAGAPVGNFNALKTGRHSPRLSRLFLAAAKNAGAGDVVDNLHDALVLFRNGMLGIGPPWAPKRRRRRPPGRPPGPDIFDPPTPHP